MEPRKKLPECPKCGAWMRARTSFALDTNVRSIYRICTRQECGFKCTSLQWYEVALNQAEENVTISEAIKTRCIAMRQGRYDHL
ncbi:ogr/Delta-like zinc finger family protein [Pectobacterium parmentieri]|uniref:ogr/Delta-like zinc finger family protein n=1 Tax=Pectobacterium parmentieri TaxID=1905730 RepID=UPI0018DF2A3E|nr:ogr/Delta-like zinc finger family protein [Pectobacterium parmentieri]